MIEKGIRILIKEIGNGVMIESAVTTHGTCISDMEILAFNKQDDFVNWIMDHFTFKKIENDEGMNNEQ